MRGLAPVALALLTVARAGADQFQLSKDGVGPIVMETHFQLVANGKNAEFSGTARNDSGVPIQRAEFCVKASAQSGCVFRVWTTSTWQPGETIRWEPLTGRVFKGFPAHEVRLTSLKFDPAARAAQLQPVEPPPPPSRLQPVQRIFVDQLDGNNGPMIREQVMALLANSGRFQPVDDPKLADATIKGRAQARQSGTETASGSSGGGSAGGVIIGRAVVGGGSSSSTSQSVTDFIVEEAVVLRLTLPSGETIWAWDDTKPCVPPRAKCAIDDLVATAQGRSEKAGTLGKPIRPDE